MAVFAFCLSAFTRIIWKLAVTHHKITYKCFRMHLLRITTIFYRTLGIIIITIKITNSLMSPTVQSIVKFPLLSLQKSHIVLKKLIRGVGGRERNMDLLLHLFMHSLVDSCRCPDQGLNPQPWHIRTTLSPTELPRQGPYLFLEI